jgi:8-oxo-dGTP pyrophosphatase MutT (NUDIX family)
MSHEIKIHTAQTSILRELLFQPVAGYTELQKPTKLTSDHFNFHIKRLIELGFVKKIEGGKYTLSSKGKEYSNKLDTDSNTIERQPKVAVLLAITREKAGKTEWLFQERRKHPYFGYWGFPTGKIRWGESILETAARELMEETGLEAEYALKGIYHERAYELESGEQLEDKIFFVISCSNPTDTLMKEFSGGANYWITLEELGEKKVYSSLKTELAIAKGEHTFVEETHHYPKVEF